MFHALFCWTVGILDIFPTVAEKYVIYKESFLEYYETIKYIFFKNKRSHFYRDIGWFVFYTMYVINVTLTPSLKIVDNL